MDAARKPRRRWFRYSLRTLLAAFTLLALVLGWNVNRVHERDRLLASPGFLRTLEHCRVIAEVAPLTPAARLAGAKAPPAARPKKTIPYLWTLLGAIPLDMDVRLPDDQYTASDVRRIRSIYPECDVRLIPSALDDRRVPF